MSLIVFVRVFYLFLFASFSALDLESLWRKIFFKTFLLSVSFVVKMSTKRAVTSFVSVFLPST